MLGEVRFRSSWEMNPLDSSVRAANSSCVSPSFSLRPLILPPMSIMIPLPFRQAAWWW